MCTYTKDLPSYLPKTEFVVLCGSVRDDGYVEIWGMVDWRTFAGIVGRKLVRLTKERPVRYVLKDSLTPKQEAALQAKAWIPKGKPQ